MKPQDAPLVTGYALACVVLFVLLWITGLDTEAFIRAGFIPARMGTELIVAPGTLVPALLTPLTAAFLHANALQLIFNLIIILFVGRQLEPALGKAAMAVLLVTSTYAASAAQWISDPTLMALGVGASGSVSALIAVYALIFNKTTVAAIGPIPGHWVRALWLAAAWIAFQLLIGVAGGGGSAVIAIWGHVGGFLAGLLLARPLLRWRFGGR